MLKPKKKLSKKEMKQDTLVTAYAEMRSFYDVNKKNINYALTALVALVILMFVYINNHRANNEKAATELGKVYSIYDAGSNDVLQYQVAIDGHPERGILGLKAIVDNYGSTASGELARFYLASAYLNLGKYDEALKNYESFSSGDKILSAAALAGAAACHEVKGEFAKAASSFEKAVNTVGKGFSSPEYLNSAARCYARAGDREKAITLLKRIKKEFPTSTFAREAERYISQYSVS